MGLNSILLCKTLILFSWLTCSMAQPKRIVCVYDPFDEQSGSNGPNISRIDPQLCTHLFQRGFRLNDQCEVVRSFGTRKMLNRRYKALQQLLNGNSALKLFFQIDMSPPPELPYNESFPRISCANDFINSTLAFLQNYSFHGIDLGFFSYDRRSFLTTDKLDFMKAVKGVLKKFDYLISATFSEFGPKTLDGQFVAEDHYDFLNFRLNRCYLQMLNNLKSNDASHNLDSATLDNQAIASSLSNKCEKQIANLTISSNASLDRINVQVVISGICWEKKVPSSSEKLDTFMEVSYKKVCSTFPERMKNNPLPLGTFGGKKILLQDSDFGLYGLVANRSLKLTYYSYNHPVMVRKKVSQIMSAGFGGVMVLDVFKDDFNNECGYGYLPMINAISQSLEAIKKSNNNVEIIAEQMEPLGGFIERGGIVLKLSYALLLLGVVSHFIYWPIYSYRVTKNRGMNQLINLAPEEKCMAEKEMMPLKSITYVK